MVSKQQFKKGCGRFLLFLVNTFMFVTAYKRQKLNFYQKCVFSLLLGMHNTSSFPREGRVNIISDKMYVFQTPLQRTAVLQIVCRTIFHFIYSVSSMK